MKLSEMFSSSFIEDIETNLLRDHIDDNDVEIEYADPQQFLVPERLDLVCKLYYIECREKGHDLTFARELYKEHIRSFTNGRYTENWNPEKNSIEKYFSIFDDLIDEIKTNGFDTEKSVVPVGNDNIILDGAHRTAIAIYFGIDLPVVRMNIDSWVIDYNRFSDMPKRYLDYMAYLYMRYSSKTYYCAVIWPVSFNNPNYEIALKFIRKYCKVIYSKQVHLNYNGLTQFAMHAYMDQTWTGGFENSFKNIHQVVNDRYAVKAPLTLVVLHDKELEDIKELKSNVRIILHDGFAKIHITDTKEEAVRLAKMLLNENSINLLNNGNIMRYPLFIKAFLKYRENVIKEKIENDVCLDTGAVLAIHGLRYTDDLDYIAGSQFEASKLVDYDMHTQEYYNQTGIQKDIEDIIYNWFDHLYCFDIMFSSLDVIYSLKNQRGETKDIVDIKLINKMSTECLYEKEYLTDKNKQYVIYYLRRIRRTGTGLIIRCLSVIDRGIRKVFNHDT